MDTFPGTPAERELHNAKTNVAALNRLLEEAEKGATLSFSDVQTRMESIRLALVELSHGRVPQTDSASSPGTVSVPSMYSTYTVHARASGQQAVTDIQRRRAQQLLAEINIIETSLQQFHRKSQQRQTYKSEVEQLLGNMNNANWDDYSSLEHLEKERSSLQYTRTRVRAMLDESSVLMKALQDQGSRLEGSGSKVADLLESLGIANTTILQILRRNKVDSWLVYGGIAICIFIMYYIW